jgi:hypothetical protein
VFTLLVSSEEEQPVTVAKAVDVLSWRMVPKLISLLDAWVSFFEAPGARFDLRGRPGDAFVKDMRWFGPDLVDDGIQVSGRF